MAKEQERSSSEDARSGAGDGKHDATERQGSRHKSPPPDKRRRAQANHDKSPSRPFEWF
jgi:hypothetical protein